MEFIEHSNCDFVRKLLKGLSKLEAAVTFNGVLECVMLEHGAITPGEISKLQKALLDVDVIYKNDGMLLTKTAEEYDYSQLMGISKTHAKDLKKVCTREGLTSIVDAAVFLQALLSCWGHSERCLFIVADYYGIDVLTLTQVAMVIPYLEENLPPKELTARVRKEIEGYPKYQRSVYVTDGMYEVLQTVLGDLIEDKLLTEVEEALQSPTLVNHLHQLIIQDILQVYINANGEVGIATYSTRKDYCIVIGHKHLACSPKELFLEDMKYIYNFYVYTTEGAFDNMKDDARRYILGIPARKYAATFNRLQQYKCFDKKYHGTCGLVTSSGYPDLVVREQHSVTLDRFKELFHSMAYHTLQMRDFDLIGVLWGEFKRKL